LEKSKNERGRVFMRQKLLVVTFIIGLVLIFAGCGRMAEEQAYSPEEPKTKMETPVSPAEPESKKVDAFKAFETQYPEEEIIYSARVDLDGDSTIENIIITGADQEIRVWFYRSGWEEVYTLSGNTYQEAMILDRGKEKHLAIFSEYPPNNTYVNVFRIDKEKLVHVFETFADWELFVIPRGFSLRYKSYQNDDGWVIANYDYVWDEQSKLYIDAN
jgi:hypothetical protein